MKHIIFAFTAVLILASCQKPNKIGYINNGDVINEYQAKKDLEGKFKLKEQAFSKKYDSIENAFNVDVQKFQVQAKRMSQKKAEERYQELGQLKQINDQSKQRDAQQLQLEFQSKIDTLIVEVKDFVKDYGKTNGYDFILGTSEGAASVIYGKEQTNLTQTVLDALNAQYKKE